MSADGEFTPLPEVSAAPRGLLLDAYTRGRYAAQAGFRTDNPCRDDPQMAAAWAKGWESAGRD